MEALASEGRAGQRVERVATEELRRRAAKEALRAQEEAHRALRRRCAEAVAPWTGSAAMGAGIGLFFGVVPAIVLTLVALHDRETVMTVLPPAVMAGLALLLGLAVLGRRRALRRLEAELSALPYEVHGLEAALGAEWDNDDPFGRLTLKVELGAELSTPDLTLVCDALRAAARPCEANPSGDRVLLRSDLLLHRRDAGRWALGALRRGVATVHAVHPVRCVGVELAKGR